MICADTHNWEVYEGFLLSISVSSTYQESDGSLKELLSLHYHNQSQVLSEDQALDFTEGVTSEQEQYIYTTPERQYQVWVPGPCALGLCPWNRP